MIAGMLYVTDGTAMTEYDPNDTSSDAQLRYFRDTYREEAKALSDEVWNAILENQRKAQMILREGLFLDMKPRVPAPSYPPFSVMKVLRCNRKGIGLRINSKLK